ncbi:MAG: TetR/AcrR family transcriptional regulator [Myxococcales bacterium]|nr:TetR/AcrR family transcriptional regulator [Myxococcales bacterium]MCB9748373.1 TetR/AcrR family transcriptional regulator [Myxococcales bacterium]
MAPPPNNKVGRARVRESVRTAYREAILEAAERVISRDGFTGVKMADIAAEAGVAAGTVYNYFKNKEAVLESIKLRGFEQIHQQMLAARALEDPLERIRSQVRGVFEYVEGRGALFTIYMQHGGVHEWIQQRIHKKGRGANQEVFARFDQLTLATLEEAVARGQVREDIALEDLAEMLGGLIDALMFTWFRQGCPPNLSEKSDLLFDMFLHGAHAR